ncbi:copper amine oxidase N-terminal domain-containing protein [Paenibacillus alvei]|uniref:Copper amine oxidase N-terminal domain-containing protein n=1 Tax=Paenibacillus alvei TaxID=44250 RepID=A0ABT4GQZ4_PAEAL|nr:copper amine oxidase N-terminal domain-containing protein [Paenibacillus alvei]MCY9759075.1 copper amine oxidase N-terminal domain-containing protein [Paenibacillus alvei]MCY9768260.1 copper amine oxidase N-terminal domain-containing protein [Paenibacillus alvei]
MKKRLSKLLLVAILSACIIPNQLFAQSSNREYAEINVDGINLKLSNKAFIEDGVTYVPFKDLFDELNMKVTYDPNTKEVAGENKLLSMKFTIGKPSVTINGVMQKADASIVENGVAYVPINYLNKKGTQLKVGQKYAHSNIMKIEGRMIRKKIHNSTEYYLGEGYTDNFSEFVPDGQGKEYKNGNVRKEPYNKDGKTGYYKDGKYEGWFIEYIPKGHISGADYRLGEFIDGNIKIAYYYNENGDLLYTKE